jgi:protein TonB
MTGLMVAGASWVFGNALIRDYVTPPPPATELIILAPETPQEVLPLPEPPKVEEVKVAEPPPLLAPEIPFVVEEPAIVAPPAPVVPIAPVTPSPAIGGSDRVPPKLRSVDKPPYPSQSIRAQEQGTTHLSVCVGANGRVNSANIAGSSGHARLDEAAVKWVRSARFTPGSIGGRAQSMCGHNVYYEWSLENA